MLLFLMISMRSSFILNAQNTFGAISNYSPTNGVAINPANMSNAKTYLDLNLIGFGAFANNNLFFFADRTIPDVFKSLDTLQLNRNIYTDYKELKKDIYYDQVILNKGRTINLFNRDFIAGPAATWNKGIHAVGIAFNGRSYSGVENIPAFMGSFLQHGFSGFARQQGKDYNLKNLRISSINFIEIKGSYSRIFYKKGKNLLSGGVSIKKFFSVSGTALTVNDLSFNVNNDSILSVHNFDADVMSTNGAYTKKGGMGIDLGFVYQKTLSNCDSYLPHDPKSGCRYIPYKYKLGFSIIDIGSVKFDKKNTVYHGYNLKDISLQQYSNFSNNPDSVLSTFSSKDDFTKGLVKNPYKIQLPTFISLQFDYNVWRSIIYVNTILVQGLSYSITTFGIRHANSLSVTPRIETKFFDFALPFSLYEYRTPQLGINFRLGPITIGSDKFINWVINSDLYGGDIYAYFKLPLYHHPKCRELIRKKRDNATEWVNKLDCSF